MCACRNLQAHGGLERIGRMFYDWDAVEELAEWRTLTPEEALEEMA